MAATAAVVPSAVLSLSLPAVLQMNYSEGNSGWESGVTPKFPEIIMKTLCPVCVCACAYVRVFIFSNRLVQIDGTASGNRGVQALRLMIKDMKTWHSQVE